MPVNSLQTSITASVLVKTWLFFNKRTELKLSTLYPASFKILCPASDCCAANLKWLKVSYLMIVFTVALQKLQTPSNKIIFIRHFLYQSYHNKNDKVLKSVFIPATLCRILFKLQLRMKKMIFIALLLCSIVGKGAKVDTITIQSNALKKATKCVVITPSNSGNTSVNYPVVYLLHGYSGNYSSWLGISPKLIQQADALGMIIVCPDGGYGSWYFDSPIDSSIRYESYMIKELLPYIDGNYPTIKNRTGRAITGLSMGGHGGLYLSIKHSALFGAAGSMSGGVDFRPFPNNWDIKKALGEYANNTTIWDSNVAINLIDKLENNKITLIIDCGVDDFFITVNRNLHKKFMDLKIDHDYIERPGAHNKAYWENSVDYQLLFFKKYFSQGI